MSLRFLLDENFRGIPWNAIVRHNAKSGSPIDARCVGEAGGPWLGTSDVELLAWCEINDRILVTFDKSTMPGHLIEHLQTGQHSPGVLTFQQPLVVKNMLEKLVLIAYASEAHEWHDRNSYL